MNKPSNAKKMSVARVATFADKRTSARDDVSPALLPASQAKGDKPQGGEKSRPLKSDVEKIQI